MKLEELGHHPGLEEFRIANDSANFETGRVIAEHKERYVVRTAENEYEAEITGHLRFTAMSRDDFPAAGDWVALMAYDSGSAIIHQILPRFSVIRRQAVGQFGETQIIAANIDDAFVVQAVDRDFNLNRIERYLSICHSSKVTPLIVLSKTDLITASDLAAIHEAIRTRIANVPVISISNLSKDGYAELLGYIGKGKTCCLLGSSGVGKSTLINQLSGREKMRTDTISQSTGKGRHVTSHRELIVLENGGILIDNPGMREVGIAGPPAGLEITFGKIASLSGSCRFKDCTHTGEDGCAVLEAVEKGEVDSAALENYLKMERERAYFESTVADRRKKEKQFGKFMKNYKKDKKRNPGQT